MKAREIYKAIDEIAPFEVHASYDNPGFLVGDENADINFALVSLDITSEVINEAKAIGAQMIISHHPVIFRPLKNIHPENPVYGLMKNGLCAICAHTNLDCANGGVKLLMMNFVVSGKSICCPRGGKRDKTITFSLNKNIFISITR